MSGRDTRMPFQLLLFTLIRVVYNTTYRMMYPFLNTFAGGLGVSLPALSAIFTARSLTGMAGPLLAPIADRRGRKTSMLLGLVCFTLGAGLVAIWPSYLTLFVGLVLTSLGNTLFLPAMQAYLGDRIAYERRGLVLAATELSWSLAFMAGVPFMGFLIAAGSWSTPFVVLAALGFTALVMLARILPATPPPVQVNGAIWHSLGRVLTHRSAQAALVLSFALTAANESVNLVFGVWMENSFGLQLAALGAASAVIGLSELGGEGLSGALVDRLGKERSIRIGLTLTALSALALPWLGSSAWGALAGLFLFYLTFEFAIVSLLPLVSEILPEARATLMATNMMAFSLGRAAGAILAPLLFTLGFQANTLASLVFNLVALGALSFLRVGTDNAALKK